MTDWINFFTPEKNYQTFREFHFATSSDKKAEKTHLKITFLAIFFFKISVRKKVNNDEDMTKD